MALALIRYNVVHFHIIRLRIIWHSAVFCWSWSAANIALVYNQVTQLASLHLQPWFGTCSISSSSYIISYFKDSLPLFLLCMKHHNTGYMWAYYKTYLQQKFRIYKIIYHLIISYSVFGLLISGSNDISPAPRHQYEPPFPFLKIWIWLYKASIV